MKNVFIAVVLSGFLTAAMPAASAIKSPETNLQQTDTVKHKTYKRHKKITYHTSAHKAARIHKQLKQADRHLRDENKVHQAQRELKKDTLRHK